MLALQHAKGYQCAGLISDGAAKNATIVEQATFCAKVLLEDGSELCRALSRQPEKACFYPNFSGPCVRPQYHVFALTLASALTSMSRENRASCTSYGLVGLGGQPNLFLRPAVEFAHWKKYRREEQ